MSIRSSQSIVKLFTTRKFTTGIATNADSTPTGTLYVNGTADAASVTVTNVTTGVYKASVTLPTLAVGDVVDLRINATVDSVGDNAIIWTDSKDIAVDSDGKTPSTIAAGDLATDSITAASVKADAVTKIQNGLSTFAGGAVASVTGNVGGNVVGSVGSVAGLTASNLDATITSRSSHSASDVWAVGTRSLTTFGTLVADIWAYATRTLSAFGFTVDTNANSTETAIKASTDNLPSDPADQSLITAATNAITSAIAALNNLSQTDVRTATGLATANLDTQIALLATAANLALTKADTASIKSTVDTNLNATISSRSSHSVTDIWNNGTRTLSSFGTLVADIATAVWGAATRTLSAFGFTVDTNANATETSTNTAVTSVVHGNAALLEAIEGIEGGGSGGSVEVSSFSSAALAQLGGLENVIITSLVIESGVLEIYRGYDYSADEGRQIAIADTDNVWPTLNNDVYMILGRTGAETVRIEGTIVDGDGAGKNIKFEPTAVQTAALERGTYGCTVFATNDNEHDFPLAALTVTVLDPLNLQFE